MTVNSYKTGIPGRNLIMKFEGCELRAYLCPAQVWTIGYGTTEGVRPGQTITQAQAELLLARDLKRFEDAVNELVKVPISQNQFDALVSFAYNCGVAALAGSTLLRKVNERRFTEAAAQFQRWNKGGGKVLTGLVRRRDAEAKLFLTR